MSKVIPKFSGEIKNGELYWPTSQITQYVRNMKDGPVMIAITRPRKPKSDKQRGYYWACILQIISDETGQDIQSIHEYCKWLFLADNTLTIPKIKSTEELSTVETEEYYANIRTHFSQEYGIYIPLPNEVGYE